VSAQKPENPIEETTADQPAPKSTEGRANGHKAARHKAETSATDAPATAGRKQRAARHTTDKKKAARHKALLIGGGACAVLVIIAAVAFALMRPAPDYTPLPETPLVVTDMPEPPPAPTSWPFPLTGIATEDREATLRRVLSVKIENSPDARPQTGLSSADVVYETIAEGGITRFNCLFQSQVPQEVGPVRSARLSDLSIVPQYDALFFFSGGNPYVIDQIAAAGLPNMSHSPASSLYYRVDYRVMPHNLYLNLAGAYDLAPELGFAATEDSPRTLEFSGDAGGAGAGGAETGAAGAAGAGSDAATLLDATSVTVPFSDSYIATWDWDASTNAYLRSMDGATIDAATGEQVGVTNVVVLWTSYAISADGLTYFIDLNGQGTAALFIGGKRIDGTWESDGSTPPRFKDASGTPILLAPGTTWFQVIDSNTSISTG
jgi:hypothetical protein